MSSSQGSETQRAALDKAQEASRLLGSGDYEGAIAAGTEAIELDFSSLGARRTRAEAYKRLGRGNEAGADLRLLASQQRQSYYVVDEGSEWDAVLGIGLGLGLIGGGVWGIAAPWVTDVTLWWPTMLGIIGLLLGLGAIVTALPNPAGTVELAGTVTGMRAETSIWDDPARFYINVSRTQFEVTRSFYRPVSEGDEVVLTVRGFRGLGDVVENLGSSATYKVIAIRRGTSSTAHQLSVSEDERTVRVPFYLHILHGNYAVRMDDERFNADARKALSEITPEIASKLIAGDWKEAIVGSWIAGLKRFQECHSEIGELLLASKTCYAGQSHAFAMACYADDASVDYLVRYLDIYLRKPNCYYDQHWAMPALMWIDDQRLSNHADRFLTPGGLWDQFTEDKNNAFTIDSCKSHFWTVMEYCRKHFIE